MAYRIEPGKMFAVEANRKQVEAAARKHGFGFYRWYITKTGTTPDDPGRKHDIYVAHFWMHVYGEVPVIEMTFNCQMDSDVSSGLTNVLEELDAKPM
jgi:hypothetical protein